MKKWEEWLIPERHRTLNKSSADHLREREIGGNHMWKKTKLEEIRGLWERGGQPKKPRDGDIWKTGGENLPESHPRLDETKPGERIRKNGCVIKTLFQRTISPIEGTYNGKKFDKTLNEFHERMSKCRGGHEGSWGTSVQGSPFARKIWVEITGQE